MLSFLPSLPSKEGLLEGAAYLSLFLLVAQVLWPKAVHVVEMIAADLTRWTERGFAFRRHLRELRSPHPPQPDSRPSPG
ncbi:MAG: hypothetical protein AB7I25_07230 [Vicinamibacterales bacterium]